METDDGSAGENDLAWKHIRAKDFDLAEEEIRRLIEEADHGDPDRMYFLFGLLASVLNSLQRFDEATQMLVLSLAEARKIHTSTVVVDVARYSLGYQYLLHGSPEQALAEAQPVSPGIGHVQCLLHSVAAQAYWKLSRREEAVTAARKAIESAPTEERRSELSLELARILAAR
jgi:tetratricopeptide (TPR) repeat protein